MASTDLPVLQQFGHVDIYDIITFISENNWCTLQVSRWKLEWYIILRRWKTLLLYRWQVQLLAHLWIVCDNRVERTFQNFADYHCHFSHNLCMYRSASVHSYYWYTLIHQAFQLPTFKCTYLIPSFTMSWERRDGFFIVGILITQHYCFIERIMLHLLDN